MYFIVFIGAEDTVLWLCITIKVVMILKKNKIVMAKYIPLDAVVAEIERRIKAIPRGETDKRLKAVYGNEAFVLNDLLSVINTLEVKEVDNIWHNANETPKGAGDKEILVQFADSHASVLEIDDWEYLDHQTKWAYLKDLT